jgi:hypothetical protein
MWFQLRGIAAIVLCLTALSSAVKADDWGDLAGFQVQFTDCVESIGVGLVPTENVEELLPPNFIPVGSGTPLTPLVVRTSRGKISVNGRGARTGNIVQIGAVIVPPDFTGDINNYTLLYYTDDLELALRLILAGVHAQYVPTLQYQIGNDNSFLVRVPAPGSPRLRLEGYISPPPGPAGSFLANWWQQSSCGVVKMSTNVPAIAIGGADLTLSTNANNALGQIVGGSTFEFPLVQQFNTFANASMNVQVSEP